MGFVWVAPESVQAAEAHTAAKQSVLATVTELPDLLNILK
jgi:hypothetical protein